MKVFSPSPRHLGSDKSVGTGTVHMKGTQVALGSSDQTSAGNWCGGAERINGGATGNQRGGRCPIPLSGSDLQLVGLRSEFFGQKWRDTRDNLASHHHCSAGSLSRGFHASPVLLRAALWGLERLNSSSSFKNEPRGDSSRGLSRQAVHRPAMAAGEDYPLYFPPPQRHRDNGSGKSVRGSRRISKKQERAQAQNELLVERKQRLQQERERVRREVEREIKGAARGEVGLEQAASVVEPPARRNWPFFRKWWKAEETEARQLTRRIVALGRRKQIDQVFDVLEAARKEGKKVNTIMMNAAMAACVNANDIDRALDLFDEMTAVNGCGVDSITYGTLLKGLGQARRLDDAFELLESMEAGTAPGRPQLSEVHLNTLVNACAEAGEALRARGILQRYRAYSPGLGPSVFTYNLLIKGYARSDNPLEALKVVEEMHLLGLPLQRVTYNSLILACVRGGDLERGLELFEEMKAEASRQLNPDLRPDIFTFTSLLKGLGEEGDLQRVLAMAEEMVAAEEGEGFIDRVAFGVIIDACIAAGSAESGLHYLQLMEQRALDNPRLKPRAHVFLSLMRAMAAQGDLPRTRQLADRFVRDSSGHVWPEERAEADELVLEAAVAAGEWQDAEAVMRRMMDVQKEKLHFSQRAMRSVVQLHTVQDFSINRLQPVPLRPEIAARGSVELLMVPWNKVDRVKPEQRIANTLPLFQSSSFVVVVDEFDTCVGVLHAEDCRWVEAQVKDVMRTPPPTIQRSSVISEAAISMYATECPVVAVLGDVQKARSSRPKLSSQLETSLVVGFVFAEDIFEAPRVFGKATDVPLTTVTEESPKLYDGLHETCAGRA